jgi:hypothetical protein
MSSCNPAAAMQCSASVHRARDGQAQPKYQPGEVSTVDRSGLSAPNVAALCGHVHGCRQLLVPNRMAVMRVRSVGAADGH